MAGLAGLLYFFLQGRLAWFEAGKLANTLRIGRLAQLRSETSLDPSRKVSRRMIFHILAI